ncbi:MAG: 5-(carboxyamino)imidazole ribonucleotide synthase [Pirellulales bacterium]|nr:5-(carboxyamino)imidazole ribonucleotide synthase [Pirellulales bacterium]
MPPLSDHHVIPPGEILGVFGSGQLGRMFALAAAQLGYRVWTFSPDSLSPAGQVCEREFIADYTDLAAVREFASQVAGITFEFENIPETTIQAAEALTRVRPAARVLGICQHRLREKQFLAQRGIPHAPFLPVNSPAELEAAIRVIGLPAILKTAGFGYDGKGQYRLHDAADLSAAWASAATPERILEGWVDFACEVSVLVARGVDGQCVTWGVFENQHARGILDVTQTPARIDPQTAQVATELACHVARQIELCGLLCVEMFVTHAGEVLVNELAPRPHNSGHLTIEASVTSQFAQQVRLLTGLPLGETTLRQPTAMANLLGELWQSGTPNWSAACAIPGVQLHLYGKTEALPGRKMGHLTAVAPTTSAAVDRVLLARQALIQSTGSANSDNSPVSGTATQSGRF